MPLCGMAQVGETVNRFWSGRCLDSGPCGQAQTHWERSMEGGVSGLQRLGCCKSWQRCWSQQEQAASSQRTVSGPRGLHGFVRVYEGALFFKVCRVLVQLLEATSGPRLACSVPARSERASMAGGVKRSASTLTALQTGREQAKCTAQRVTGPSPRPPTLAAATA